MSVQNGWIEVKKTKRGRVFLLRFRVRDHSRPSGWRTVSEPLANCKTRKEAEREKQRRSPTINEMNQQHSEAVSGEVRTVRQFIENEWELYLEGQQVKPSTRYSYASMLTNHVLPRLGDKPLDEVRTTDVSELFAGLTGKSRKYVLNIWAIVHLVFDLAEEHRCITSNPVSRRLHRPKKGTLGRERGDKPTLTVAEIGSLIGEIQEEWRNLFLVLAYTGVRIGEALALTYADICEERREITVSRNIWRGKLQASTKTDEVTLRYVSDALLAVLREQRRTSPATSDDDLLFSKADGSPLDPNFLRREVLYPAMDRAGIRRGPRTHGCHIFRHTAGSIVHKKTGSMKLAQLQLGHANMATTSDTYVHTDRDQLELAGNVLAEAIGPILPNNCPLKVTPADLQK